MKTSTLIQRLQEIDKTVSFDADVVTDGRGIYPLSLVRVKHDPPDTYLIFERDEALSRDAGSNELSDEEFDLLVAFRSAPPEVRQAVQIVLSTGRLPSAARS